ncbi:hypothetical protein HanXRQr2_Chr07g0300291 [Helianthus annuus]|uniref:Uncharacterized protein n=1 Tax=Helianthus annuus TaxID=4232 RepID=A0A9K3ILK1_HELAN|nr:hypothetical protein HanXRQr2_Chr07g0300291 [Helianthus annuus]
MPILNEAGVAAGFMVRNSLKLAHTPPNTLTPPPLDRSERGSVWGYRLAMIFLVVLWLFTRRCDVLN